MEKQIIVLIYLTHRSTMTHLGQFEHADQTAFADVGEANDDVRR
jgi:hypothetical protein